MAQRVSEAEMAEVVRAAMRFASHQARVRRVPHLEDDVVEVALLAVAKAQVEYDAAKGTFAAFAYWPYRGAVANFIKKERRRQLMELPYPRTRADQPDDDAMEVLLGIFDRHLADAVDEIAVGEAGSPEARFLRREYHEKAARLVTAMSPADQKLLILRHVEAETWPAIGELLGVPMYVARDRGEKLIQELRDALSEPPPGPKPVHAGKRKR
jgi:RNA polymerase sigma factor (sigma-70 family)